MYFQIYDLININRCWLVQDVWLYCFRTNKWKKFVSDNGTQYTSYGDKCWGAKVMKISLSFSTSTFDNINGYSLRVSGAQQYHLIFVTHHILSYVKFIESAKDYFQVLINANMFGWRRQKEREREIWMSMNVAFYYYYKTALTFDVRAIPSVYQLSGWGAFCSVGVNTHIVHTYLQARTAARWQHWLSFILTLNLDCVKYRGAYIINME